MQQKQRDQPLQVLSGCSARPMLLSGGLQAAVRVLHSLLSNRRQRCVMPVPQAVALCSPLPPPLRFNSSGPRNPGDPSEAAARTHAAGLRDQPVSRVLTWPVHSDVQLFLLCWSGFREVLGVDALWPILMAANALPALVQLLTLPFFPDSPRYLLIDKKDKEGCIKGKEMGRKAFILAKRKIWENPTDTWKRCSVWKETLGLLALKPPAVLTQGSPFCFGVRAVLAQGFALSSARILWGMQAHGACALSSQGTDAAHPGCV